MDLLILAPPICTPAEPPSGAFVLAAGLAGWGAEVGLYDLSLPFLAEALGDSAPINRALSLLRESDGYDLHAHRSTTGVLHKQLKGFAKLHPGWHLSLMDLLPPENSHDPLKLQELLKHSSPFKGFWRRLLLPLLEQHRPRKVIISLAYLSQLAASLDLQRFLQEQGIQAIVGGSLPNSLRRTGRGFGALQAAFLELRTGDGLQLLGDLKGRLLDRLAWPQLLNPGGLNAYLSCRPILPLPLSTGCYWDRCLFCPDRGMVHHRLPEKALRDLLEASPPELLKRRPLVHLLDSAIPPAALRRFLPLAKQLGLSCYGFARPTRSLRKDGLLREAAESGCLMLQLGAEGGSETLLNRFDKGLDPQEAAGVIQEAAAWGIRSYLYMLFGLPGERETDREASLRFLQELEGAVDFLNLSIFNLPRESELGMRAEEFGLKISDYGEDPIQLYRPFNCQDGSQPRREARRFLTHLREAPGIKPVIRRTPRWLRAAHLALARLPGRRWP